MEFKSNARRNQELEEGSVFDLKGNKLGISIHHFVGCGDNWYLSCNKLGISDATLSTNDFSEAVSRSKDIIAVRLKALTDEYTKIKDDAAIQFVKY